MVIAVAMVVLAIAWIVWPLLRPQAGAPVEHAAANVAIFKDQFADLDADLARGTITAQQHSEAKAELERRLLDDVHGTPAASSPAPRSRWPAIAVALLIPVAAAALYWQIGTPEVFTSELAKDGQPTHEQIEAMIEQVNQRLEREPENADGWAILARTYYTLGRFTEASAAYARLFELRPDDADMIADYADALAMSQGRRLTGKPLQLVQRALQINHTQWKALAMAGTEAFERKDYSAALDYWQRLLASVPPGSQVAQQIQGSIDEARKLAGLPPSAPKEDGAVTAVAGRSVSGTVALSVAMSSKAQPNDAVFVFARPADGSRMPVAVVRARVADLPLKFTLDDSRSMTGGPKISSLSEVIVGARVSRSGNAIPASGDLQGATEKVKVGASDVALQIDRVVP